MRRNFEKGHDFAEEIRHEQEEPQSVDKVASTIEKLVRLRDARNLTVAEFGNRHSDKCARGWPKAPQQVIGSSPIVGCRVFTYLRL